MQTTRIRLRSVKSAFCIAEYQPGFYVLGTQQGRFSGEIKPVETKAGVFSLNVARGVDLVLTTGVGRLTLASVAGELVSIDVVGNAKLSRFSPFRNSVMDMCSIDGDQLVACSSFDGSTVVADTLTGKLIRRIDRYGHLASYGKCLIIANGCRVVGVEWSNGNLLWERRVSESVVGLVASSEESFIAMTSKSLNVFDNLRVIASTPAEPEVQFAEGASMIAISANKRVAIGFSDGRVNLYDGVGPCEHPAEVARFRFDSDSVRACAISESRAAVLTSTGHLSLWQFNN